VVRRQLEQACLQVRSLATVHMALQVRLSAVHTLIFLENTTTRTKGRLMRMAGHMVEGPALWIHTHQTVEDMVEWPLRLIPMNRTKENIMVMGGEDTERLLQDEVAQGEVGLAEVMAIPKTQDFQHKAAVTVRSNKTHMLLMLDLLVVHLADMVDLSQIASTRTTQIIRRDPSPHNHNNNTLLTLHVLRILDAAIQIDLILATITNKDAWHPRR